MTARLGRLTATLAEPLTKIPAELIDKINRNINPPEPVTGEMVQVRAMYVVNDKVNSFGGCFPIDEHEHLAELLVDSPVLVGHRKDKLPVARTFHAVACTENGEAWVKAYFYWLKSAEGAESLRENIDAGIYKECSIGFTFAFAECSICGRDIRLCEHEPFRDYTVVGEDVACHFNYRQIERVLESSLVYRGATPNTRISRELLHLTGIADPADSRLAPLHSVGELKAQQEYLIIPRYESLAVTIDRSDRKPKLRFHDGSDCVSARVDTLLRDIPDDAVEGRLVGLRGKQRCSIGHLIDFLLGEPSDVRRLVLYLLPTEEASSSSPDTFSSVRPIPHRIASREQLIRAAREITTKSGVEIFPFEPTDPATEGHACHPDELKPHNENHYQLAVSAESGHARLTLTLDRQSSSFLVRQYSHRSLQRGARFVADPVTALEKKSRGALVGIVTSHRLVGEAFELALTGPLSGRFVLQPISLHGRSRLLFYRAGESEVSDDHA